jgi:uncharacterized membrane protein YgdD (TMEM256/DUF423 family)
MKDSNIIAAGAVNMLLAVACGAFGAHALKSMLTSDMLAIWQTAVHYQMVHALGLIAIGILLPRGNASWLQRAAMLMLAGMVIFSGSLYLLALSGQRWLGAITPLGGLAFLAAWAMLAWGSWRD